LIEAIYVQGFLVCIDAIGCHKVNARKITDKGGDYLLMVNANNPVCWIKLAGRLLWLSAVKRLAMSTWRKAKVVLSRN
jgi:hypothetical protein